MTMTRQQLRQKERVAQKIAEKVAAFRKSSPMAEETYHHGYEEGWKVACNFCMRICYAAAAMAMHDLDGYSTVRNTRLLRTMDRYVTDTLTSDEIIEDAFSKAGVRINFQAPFEDERVQEAGK